MDVKKASDGELAHEIIATKRLLADQFISGPRKRDLLKYMKRLKRERYERGWGKHGND